jgi:hypothetical protein
MIRFLFIIFLSVVSGVLGAQPLVGYYLGSRSEMSKGKPYKLIEEDSEVLIKGMSTVPFKVKKEFNSFGNIVSSISFNSSGGKTAETSWEYLDGKRLSRKHHRSFANLAGWREEIVIIDYDENTNFPTKIEFSKEGSMVQWALLFVDTLGKIELSKVYASSGAHIFTEKLIYLEQSNMIRVMVHRANGQFYGSWTYPIDPNKEFNVESVSRQYYPNGDIMVETLTNAAKGDQAYFYEYEYDSQGNWLVKKTYQVNLGKNNSIRNKKIENRVTRKISYH